MNPKKRGGGGEEGRLKFIKGYFKFVSEHFHIWDKKKWRKRQLGHPVSWPRF